MNKKAFILTTIGIFIGLALITVVFIFLKLTNLNSGVRATVTLGPTCPVMRIDVPDQCQDKPYSTNFVVKIASTNIEVAKVKSNDNGYFEIKLIPGKYLIVPESDRMLPRAEPVTVDVKDNEFTSVNIVFDSGIR